MKLNIKAMAFAAGIVWAFVVFVAGLANLFWSGYGAAFLKVLASVYPGYHASGKAGDLMAGVLYALVDGALFGLVFAWVYNRFAGTATAISREENQAAGVRYPPVEPQS